MHSSDIDQLPKKLTDEKEGIALSLSMKVASARAVEISAVRVSLVLQLRNYKVFRRTLERKVAEKKFIWRRSMAAAKRLEERQNELKDEHRLLQKTNKELFGKCAKQKGVGEKSVETNIRSVPARFVDTKMSTLKVILKYRLRETFEVDFSVSIFLEIEICFQSKVLEVVSRLLTENINFHWKRLIFWVLVSSCFSSVQKCSGNRTCGGITWDNVASSQL